MGARDAILSMHGHDPRYCVRSSGLDAARLVGEVLDLLCVHLPGVHHHVVAAVNLLLFCNTSANRFAKGLRVYGGTGRSSSHTVEISGAFAIQFLNDLSTAAHKARRLLDQSLFTASMINVSLHEESAHVRLCHLH